MICLAKSHAVPQDIRGPTWEDQWKNYFRTLVRNPAEARQIIRQWRDQADVLEQMLHDLDPSVACVHPDLVGHA